MQESNNETQPSNDGDNIADVSENNKTLQAKIKTMEEDIKCLHTIVTGLHGQFATLVLSNAQTTDALFARIEELETKLKGSSTRNSRRGSNLRSSARWQRGTGPSAEQIVTEAHKETGLSGHSNSNPPPALAFPHLRRRRIGQSTTAQPDNTSSTTLSSS